MNIVYLRMEKSAIGKFHNKKQIFTFQLGHDTIMSKYIKI